MKESDDPETFYALSPKPELHKHAFEMVVNSGLYKGKQVIVVEMPTDLAYFNLPLEQEESR